ncbi:ketol-acid reductoisomerase [Hyphobacterium sp. SN044]|uniref:ketol-acid reductoisomerase n=1 Tax=Hyphobacterium sp. SN044 TaxID=2912575 RepID=UPI001F2CAF5B|nr:ketol-acid reductoisomerase [Hyphobacterium sp. SN044]MCF8878415.1 ketol-acid reductoisomerase [Hyphobacterium sp. SN044]
MTRTDPLAPLRPRKLAIVGYGNHGRSHALNLRDSGIENLRIGLREGSPSRAKAEAEGFTVGTVAEVAAWADAVSILAADEAHAEIWENDIAPNRPHGQALMFCHGYSIRYGLLDPAPDADIILAAAKGPGGAVRTEYEKGRGLIGYWAVHRDASGTAKDLAIAYLEAIGCGRVGIFETTFEEEAVSDLFGEQAVLVGGLVALAKASFKRLTAAGVSPRMAYIDCVHEMKYLADLIHDRGIEGMYAAISDTAEFGARLCESDLADALGEDFDRLMDNIRSGRFAEEWNGEHRAGAPRMKSWRAADKDEPVDIAGRELRARLKGGAG